MFFDLCKKRVNFSGLSCPLSGGANDASDFEQRKP